MVVSEKNIQKLFSYLISRPSRRAQVQLRRGLRADEALPRGSEHQLGHRHRDRGQDHRAAEQRLSDGAARSRETGFECRPLRGSLAAGVLPASAGREPDGHDAGREVRGVAQEVGFHRRAGIA